MPKAGEIRYCPELGGRETNAAFVWIPPGSFWMGNNNEQSNPTHLVIISKGFWLQQCAMTDKQYHRTPYNFPTTKVAWDAVFDFCKGKPLRMPTEAEWEYAARANTAAKYVYSGSNLHNNVAWTSTNAKRSVKEVAQLKSNTYGLYDMSGNVSTFCSDPDEFDSILPKTIQVDPKGLRKGRQRSNRGGGWEYYHYASRVALRGHTNVKSRSESCGIRLIWEPQDA